MDLCKWHEAFDSRIGKTEQDVQKIYEVVDKIRNRLPVWATCVIAAMTAVIGWLIKK